MTASRPETAAAIDTQPDSPADSLSVPLQPGLTGLSNSPTLAVNELVRDKRARQETVYHLGFGEAPFTPPSRLQAALAENAFRHDYAPVAGVPRLREAILDHHARLSGLDPTGYDAIVAPGSKALIFAFQHAISGDLLMPVPSWVTYGPQARMLGREVLKVPTELGERMHIDAEALRDKIRTARGVGSNPTKLILNAPNNPTGLSMSDANLRDLAAVCAEEDIYVLSDEIYALTAFDGRYPPSIADYAPDRTVITSALSKHMSLGGWRLGYALVPKAMSGLFEALRTIASESWSTTSTPTQYAAIPAFEGHADVEAFIAHTREIYAHVGRWAQKRLTEAGLICPAPTGAFYLYPDFEPMRAALAERNIRTSDRLALYLLEDLNVATLPGTAFGAEADVLTLRLSMTDFDGARALADLHGEADVPSCCPSLAKGIEIIADFALSI